MNNLDWIKVAMSATLAISCSAKALCADTNVIRSIMTPAAPTEIVTQPVSEETNRSSNHRRGMIAVALGGGGCKAIADIGVLRALEAAHVPIDCIIGSSSGATIGALYAAGTPLDEIERLFRDGEIQKAMVPRTVPQMLFLPVAKLANVVNPRRYGGITDGARFESFLSKRLPASFNGTKIPFYAVVTDLTNGQSAMLHNGDLVKAVHASNSLPPVFQPVELDGKLYADGGLQRCLSADVLRQTGAKMLISVLDYTPIQREPLEKYKSVKAIMGRTEHIMLGAIDAERISGSNIVIEPNTEGTPLMTTKKDIIDQTIRSGEQAGALAIPAVARMENSFDRQSASISNPQ